MTDIFCPTFSNQHKLSSFQGSPVESCGIIWTFNYKNDNKHMAEALVVFWWKTQQASDWLTLINRCHVTYSQCRRKDWIFLGPKHPNYKEMNYPSAKFCLVSLIFVFTAQQCFSTVQKRKTPEQRSQLALPRVTCSPRRIKAVFGPLVKSNIRVKGKIALFDAVLYLQTLTRMAEKIMEDLFKMLTRSILRLLYICIASIIYVLCCFLRRNRGHDPSASIWGLLWSESGQREEPDHLLHQQIWQLLCSGWGKLTRMCAFFPAHRENKT